MARSSIRYERLANDVRFTIYENKPDFVSDNEWSVVVRPEIAQTLPTSPTTDEMFWLPEVAAWIGFYWTSHMERGAGLNIHDDVCHGPFRVLVEPPSEVEIAKAIQENRLVRNVRAVGVQFLTNGGVTPATPLFLAATGSVSSAGPVYRRAIAALEGTIAVDGSNHGLLLDLVEEQARVLRKLKRKQEAGELEKRARALRASETVNVRESASRRVSTRQTRVSAPRRRTDWWSKSQVFPGVLLQIVL